MVTVTQATFTRQADPTPEEIRERCAEIQAARAAKWKADNPPLTEEEHRESERIRVSQYRQRKAIDQANAELQETEQLDDVWIPVPPVDEYRREASVVRHQREFYTRFFPSWSRLSTPLEQAARAEARQWRWEAQSRRDMFPNYTGPQNVPTWTVEPSMADRTPREIIDEELRCMGMFHGQPGFDEMWPEFIALQRRVLARYLWGIRRDGRTVPRTPNWGFKLANQLMQERDETEPLDLFDVAPETVARVTNGVKLPAKPKRQRKRVQRDIVPFKTTLARKRFRSSR